MISPIATGQPGPPAAAPASRAAFDTVLRGYDRRQVDEAISRREEEVDRLRAELAEMTRQRRLATDHAEATEQELRELTARSAHAQPASPEDGFGFRAEKLLRLAEQEAAETRSSAGRESAAIIEKSRTEAERHRHEAEQALIARTAVLEQQAAQRSTELQEREKQIADQLAAARQQAEEMHAAAVRAAERLREESEAAAEDVRARSEAAMQRRRQQAEQEVARLARIRSDARSELGRLAELLATELSGQVTSAAPAAPADAPDPTRSTPPSPGSSPTRPGSSQKASEQRAGRRTTT